MLLPLSLVLAVPGAPIPSPVPLVDGELLLDASPAVRAATVHGIENLLDQPRRFRFACELNEHMGAPRRCVPAEELSEPITWAEFFRRAERTGDGDLVESRALERARSIRVQGRADGRHRRLVLVDVVMALQDALPPLPSAGIEAAADVTFEEITGAVPAASLYPEGALRSEIWADVEITCRITLARSLLCRDGRVAATGDAEHRYDRAFIMATYQLSSMQKLAPLTRGGQDVRGKDVVLRVHWSTPSN